MTDFSDFSGNDTNTSNPNGAEFVIDVDTSDAREPMCVEDGEYLVRITGFRKDGDGNVVRTSATGNKYMIVTLDIPDEEFSKGFSKILSLPSPEMEPKRLNMVKWDLDIFKRCFGLMQIDASCIGKTGYAILTKKNDPQYGEQNEVSKFIAGA